MAQICVDRDDGDDVGDEAVRPVNQRSGNEWDKKPRRVQSFFCGERLF